MTLAELLDLILFTAVGGIGVWFSLVFKRHNDLAAQREQHRAKRERKRAYEIDCDRFEAVSGEAALRLLRELNAGRKFPPLTSTLRKPPIWPDAADDEAQFVATWVYDHQTDGASPRARTFDTDTATSLETIETALYASGGAHLLEGRSLPESVVLGLPRPTGALDATSRSDVYVLASEVPPEERANYSFAMFYCEECIVWVYRITSDDLDGSPR